MRLMIVDDEYFAIQGIFVFDQKTGRLKQDRFPIPVFRFFAYIMCSEQITVP